MQSQESIEPLPQLDPSNIEVPLSVLESPLIILLIWLIHRIWSQFVILIENLQETNKQLIEELREDEQ